MAYRRYNSFIEDGSYTKIPFIEISEGSSDVSVYYEVGKTRLDLLSYQYYGDPNYGWLILQANPSVGSMEFCIDDGTKLRIPYPLDSAIQRYEDGLKVYKKLQGLD